MNYLIKKLGCKEDRVSVGLHRLSIALICWVWMFGFVIYHIYVPRVYHGFFNLLLWSCGFSIIIYLFFTLFAWVISVSRYGFRSSKSVEQQYNSKRLMDFFVFISFKQKRMEKDRASFVLQIIGVVCSLLFFIPLTTFGLLFCYNCFGKNWDGMSQEEIDKIIDSRNDIGLGFPREEFLKGLFFEAVGSIFIYLSFCMLAWILSGFRYGDIREKKQITPIIDIQFLANYINNIPKNLAA